jgi:hypothetical protein
LSTTDGFDLVSMSLGFTGTVVPGAMETVMRRLTRTGRSGRGIPQFYSAGNAQNGTDTLGGSYGQEEWGFASGAVIVEGGAERAYSGINLLGANTGEELDWCAPSYDYKISDTEAGEANEEAENLSIPVGQTPLLTTESVLFGRYPADDDERWQLAVSPDPSGPPWYRVVGQRPQAGTWALPLTPASTAANGEVPADASLLTIDTIQEVSASIWRVQLSASLPVGTLRILFGARQLGTVHTASGGTIEVTWEAGADEASLTSTDWIFVEAAGTPFKVVPSGTGPVKLNYVSFLGAPAVGAVIYERAYHARRFGATSAANALSAGVGALVLRANPQLTWRELQFVLRTTAVKSVGAYAAPASTYSGPAPAPAGLDPNLTRNNEVGYGRLDAQAAVARALAMRHERADLHLRDSLLDQGSGLHTPSLLSPDIWVLAGSGGTPAYTDYGLPGPHQNPIEAQTNRVVVRVRNRGNLTSPRARLILRVAAGHHAPFPWPNSWDDDLHTDIKRIGQPVWIEPLATGAVREYVIGWTATEQLPADEDPHLLAELTPQDGRLAESAVHRNTNLAVRSITYAPATGASPTVTWLAAPGVPLSSTASPGPLNVQVEIHSDDPIAHTRFVAWGARRAGGPPEMEVVSLTSWNPATQVGAFTFNLPPEWAACSFEAQVRDTADRRTTSVRHLAVRLPVQMCLLVDYSGSMRHNAPDSKWKAARRAALMLQSLFDLMSKPGDVLQIRRFWHAGGVTQLDPALPSTLPAATNLTPLGDALEAGAALLAGASAAERVVVLMTDGKENRGTTLEAVRAQATPPSITTEPLTGVRVHACAFGGPGVVDTDALDGLVHGGDAASLRHFNGLLHSTENLNDPDLPAGLKEMFLQVLAQTTGAELIGPIGQNESVFIEEGVERAWVIAPEGGSGLSIAGPTGSHALTPVLIDGTPSHRVAELTAPPAGTWTLSGTPTSPCYVIVDLRLRTVFTAEPTSSGGFDCTGRVEFDGLPIEDAHLTVHVIGPGESIGEALIKTRGKTGRRRKDRMYRRGVLLNRLLVKEQRTLKLDRRRPQMVHSGAGHYHTHLSGPLRTGTWTFEFRATGQTPSGQAFERVFRETRTIRHEPDAENSTVRWSKRAGGHLSVTPRDKRGDRLGPGLTLSAQVGGRTIRLKDQGNGNYTAFAGRPAPVTLSRAPGAAAIPPVRHARVRIRWDSIVIKPTRDRTSRWRMQAVIQLGRQRTVTRWPSGRLQFGTHTVNELIFDQRVPKRSQLRVQIDGVVIARASGVRLPGHTLPRASLVLRGNPRNWAGKRVLSGNGWRATLVVEVR